MVAADGGAAQLLSIGPSKPGWGAFLALERPNEQSETLRLELDRKLAKVKAIPILEDVRRRRDKSVGDDEVDVGR